jgi:hypothetical protein
MTCSRPFCAWEVIPDRRARRPVHNASTINYRGRRHATQRLVVESAVRLGAHVGTPRQTSLVGVAPLTGHPTPATR